MARIDESNGEILLKIMRRANCNRGKAASGETLSEFAAAASIQQQTCIIAYDIYIVIMNFINNNKAKCKLIKMIIKHA